MSEIVTIKLACAVAHLKEFIDTAESLDLDAATGILADPEVKSWIAENQVMLPVRRDGFPAL